MKQFTRNIAAVTTALQFLFLPFPAMAEETIQPYYTVTAAPANQDGVLTLEDGTEWVKVLNFEYRGTG